MRLEYRANNAYDSIVLVNEDGIVRSDWTVGPDELRDFCDCAQSADDWDDRFGNEHSADEYGVLVAYRQGHELRAVDHALWSSRVERVLH